MISHTEYKKYIPSRLDVLDKSEYNKISNDIINEAPLYFLPSYVHEEHLQDEKYKSSLYKIILMGILQDGRRASLIIDDIEPYFEVMLEKTKYYSAYDETHKTMIEQIGENIILTSEQQKMLNNILSILEEEIDAKNSRYSKPLKYELFKAKPFKLYREEPIPFVRFYYNKLKHRSSAINLLNNYNTAHDDKSCYYRVVCRDLQISFSSWSIISKYNIKEVDIIKDKVFRINYNNIKMLDTIPEFLKKDKTMSMSWDIETYTPDMNGNLPSPNNEDDKIICIGITFQWVNAPKSFLRICLIDYPCFAKEDTINIICCNETNIIKMFGKIYNLLKPEIIQGFNDSSYDWDWLIKRASHTTGLLTELAENFSSIKPWFPYTDKLILERYFKKENVKIEADTYASGYSLMLNGYIPIDVRTIFRQLYPTAEFSSLKWYLSQNKLGGKEDMPIHILFDTYKRMDTFMKNNNYHEQLKTESKIVNPEIKDMETYEKLKSDLSDVAFYCIVDADRCYDLMKIRSVIMDKREVSKLAYCSLYDAFYRANGMKVRNLTISIGQRFPFNIRFTNITSNEKGDDGKYPGAYVFPPKKGLKTSKLSFEERIKKCEYYKNKTADRDNKYKDWENTSKEEIDYFNYIVEKYGATKSNEEIKNIETIEEKKLPNKLREFLLEPIGRPIAGLDFSSLYPSLIRTYNLSPEMCVKDPNNINNKTKALARELDNKDVKITKVDFQYNDNRKLAYFIHHNCIYDINDPNFKFGVYPYILDDLFKKRSIIKKEMSKYDHLKEEMEAKFSIKDLLNMPEYEDIIFNKNYLNSKQNALKVFMNTFYGECGNKLSPFFVLEVAGGITKYGKDNIKKAEKWVLDMGCRVYYGDTDSIYISMPESNFDIDDRKFYSGQISKIDYWTNLVNKSFIIIKDIMNTVNSNFKNDNGTTFLSMAYEEFLYVVLFAAKKKYYGIEHKNIANFKPKDIFTRGLEVKKRGVSNFLRKEFTDIMWKSCSPDNIHDIIELVLDKIDKIYTSNIDLKNNIEDFVQTDVYKPAKKNIKVHTFVNRMKECGIEIKPNERFEYVIVKRYPYKYDERGRKDVLSVGDKMELVETVIKENLEIDLDHYMKNSINGQLARLIAYHDMFHVDPIKDNTETKDEEYTAEELSVAETKIYDNACKYIENYCKQYYSNYNSVGIVYKTIFNKTNTSARKELKKYDTFTSKLLTSNITDEIDIWFEKYAEKNAENQIKETKKNKSYGDQKLKMDISEYVKQFPKEHKIKAAKEKFYLLEKIYCNNTNVKSLYIKRLNIHKRQMEELRNKFKIKKHSIINLFNGHNSHVNNIVKDIKSIIHIPSKYFEASYGMDINNDDETINNKNIVRDNNGKKDDSKKDDSKKDNDNNDDAKDDSKKDIDNNDDENDNDDENINIELKTTAEKIINSYDLDKKNHLYTEKLFQDENKIKELNTIREIYNDMYSSYLFIKRTESIVNAIKKYRNNLIGFIDTPKDINEVKKNDIKVCLKNIDKLNI
jgi:DNA polymerase elongation subunit (family B)